METISNTVWQRKGSCVVFDQFSLGSFIAGDNIISLREALGWLKGVPSVPPVSGRTLLVAGLETMVETLPPEEVNDFLTRCIRPLLIELQNRWTDCAVVFGFSAHEKAFEETSLDEEVLFRRGDRKKVRLSEGLWDGSATLNMKRIVREDQDSGKEKTVGYYVARIS